MSKKLVLKIVFYILCVVLVLTYFLFDVYISDKEYTMLQATSSHWYFAFALLLPILFAIFDSLKNDNIKWLLNVTVSCCGLILSLIMSMGDVIMREGWYVMIGCYLVLSVITALMLRRQTKIYTEKKNQEIKEENERFAEELMKNDNFKK